MKKIILLCLVSVLAGCSMADYQTTPNLPENIGIKAKGKYYYVDNVNFNYPNLSFDKAEQCASLEISNDTQNISVTSQPLMPAGAPQAKFGGGNVILSRSANAIVAAGNTSAADGLVKRFYLFKVLLTKKDTGVSVRFSNIKTSITTFTGASSSGVNPTPLGAWVGAKPLLAYNELKNISDNIANCMK